MVSPVLLTVPSLTETSLTRPWVAAVTLVISLRASVPVKLTVPCNVRRCTALRTTTCFPVELLPLEAPAYEIPAAASTATAMATPMVFCLRVMWSSFDTVPVSHQLPAWATAAHCCRSLLLRRLWPGGAVNPAAPPLPLPPEPPNENRSPSEFGVGCGMPHPRPIMHLRHFR